MKNTLKLKPIAILLLLIMTLSIFASCKVENTETEDTSNQESQTTTSTETTIYPEPTVADYSGYTYKMLVMDNTLWVPLYFSEAGAETGDLMNDALYKREQKIEDTYKCELSVTADANAQTTFENSYLGGEIISDVSMFKATHTMTLATKGLLYDINTVEEMNLEGPWWDKRIQQEYLVGEKLFALEGDFNVRDDLRTMSIVYNKDIYNDLGYNSIYGTPYDIVANNEWTYEKMMAMINGISKNLDSDTNMTQDDFWGMLSELSAPYYFFLGSGKKTIQNDNGELTLAIKESSAYEAFYDIVSDTMQMVTNTDILLINNGKVVKSDVWAVAVQMFKEDKTLFRSTTLSEVIGLLDMNSDYGMLPIPAYYDEQDEYYCWVSGKNHTPLSIPKNIEDIERTAIITEAIAYHSMYSGLTDAFYDQLAEARLCRSEDDVGMLNIIFATKTYDLDLVCGITGVESSMYYIAKATNLSALSSNLQAQKDASQRFLDAFIAKIESKNP